MEFSYLEELRRILKQSKFHVIQGETGKWHDNVWHDTTWHHEMKNNRDMWKMPHGEIMCGLEKINEWFTCHR